MSSVKRYAVCMSALGQPSYTLSDKGNFVLHSDYLALEQERDALAAKMERIMGDVHNDCNYCDYRKIATACYLCAGKNGKKNNWTPPKEWEVQHDR